MKRTKSNNAKTAHMKYRFDAFISYKHTEHDIKIAEDLLYSLEHYTIPFHIRKQVGIKKIGQVFRDKEELQATADLTAEIRQALMESKFLIVICSPEAKAAKWVTKEIEIFMQTHENARDNILMVLAEGEPGDAIPEILMCGKKLVTNAKGKKHYAFEPVEPLAVDYRDTVSQKEKEKVEFPRIVSTMIGCRYDELMQRRRAYEIRRASFLVFAAMSVFTFFVISLLINQNSKYDTLKEESGNLAERSENAYNNGYRQEAIELALEAMPARGKKRPLVPEAKYALQTATEAYQTEEEKIGIVNGFSAIGSIKDYCTYQEGEGKYIAILGTDDSIEVWDTKSGRQVLQVPSSWARLKDISNLWIEMCEENQLLVISETWIASFNLEDESLNWEQQLGFYFYGRISSMSFNLDNIVIGLKNESILILDKKTGEQIEQIFVNGTLETESDNDFISVHISQDGHYIIYRNQRGAVLYDRVARNFHYISDLSFDAGYDGTEVDDGIIENWYVIAGTVKSETVTTNETLADKTMTLCYDINKKQIVWKNEEESSAKHGPRLRLFSDVQIEGTERDAVAVIVEKTVLLMDCNSGEQLCKTEYSQRIKDVFMQKSYGDSWFIRDRDYGILLMNNDEWEYGENVLSSVFEDGTCADYSFIYKQVSPQYHSFQDGVIDTVKSGKYHFVSYENAIDRGELDINTAYFNRKTKENESVANKIIAYGKKTYDVNWKKVDGTKRGSVVPYENGFFILMAGSEDSGYGICMYYDAKTGKVAWKTKLNNSYERGLHEYLGISSSKKCIVLGYGSHEEEHYKLLFLDALDGSLLVEQELMVEINGDSYHPESNKMRNGGNKIFFSVELTEGCTTVVSYDLESSLYDYIETDSDMEIISVSPDGKYVCCKEFSNVKNWNLLDMENKRIIAFEDNEIIKSNSEMLDIGDSIYWMKDSDHIIFVTYHTILLFSKDGKLERTIEVDDCVISGFGCCGDTLFVMGYASGTPMLYQYLAKSGELISSSILKGKYEDWYIIEMLIEIWEIECLETFDSEFVLLLDMGFGYSKGWTIDCSSGKVTSFIDNSVSYNSDMDVFYIENSDEVGGVITRYTSEELVEKGESMLSE